MSATLLTSKMPWTLPGEGDVLAGKYRILGVLGKGGLAIVYAAMHDALEQRVAIKMLLPDWAGAPDVAARFAREGRSAIRIRSEHVVRVLDVDVSETGAPYLVLEYLDGRDLDTVIAEEGPLSMTRAVDYVLQACEPIAEAHSAGIVHRDLKPANLFLTRRPDGSDSIKVLDFGISKDLAPRPSEMDLTSPDIVMGSPQYMSPEQLTSTASVDERSDIWSLGAILYELLVGKPPFHGDTGPQICVNVMQEPVPALADTRPDIPDALEATIQLCLEKEPSKRFANVGELALALAAFGSPESAHASADRTVRVLQGAGIIPTAASGLWISPQEAARRAAPPIAPYQGTVEPEFHFHRRRPGLIAAGALFLMAAIGCGAFYYWWQDVETAGRTPATKLAATAVPAPPPPPPPEPPPASAARAEPPAPAPAPKATATTTVASESTTRGDPTRPATPTRPSHPTRAQHRPPPAPPHTADVPPVGVAPNPEYATPYTGTTAAPSVSPPPTPPAPTATTTATSSDQLFDERK